MPLEAGQVFAGYTILRVLGHGGMGSVYLAAHPRLPREDALKVLPANFTADPEYRGRFLREADLAAGLSHPSIVGVHDRGEFEGQFWITMEYVAGTDASRLLRSKYPGGIPLEEVVPIITAVGSALDYAHHRGLLHRDVKPANILLTEPDGQAPRVFLADFGIARRIDDAAGLTATNMTVGTAAYAAPEQLKGEPLNGRADQYALACSAFHLLTGSPPFDFSNIAVVITKHITAPPPPISASRPELSYLDPVFATAMTKKPANRFGSCAEFAHFLGQPSSAKMMPYPRETPPSFVVPTPAPPKKGGHPFRTAALAAVILLLVAGGIFAGVKLIIRQDRSTTAATGPLNGSYRADFGPVIGLDDVSNGVAVKAFTATYGIRSVCGSGGCVATAIRLGGVPVTDQTLVLDKIGERWVAVAVGSDQCQNATSEFWQVLSLQQRPDGTFAGDYSRTSHNECAAKQTVTLTRTGDVDLNSLPDPSGQRPRVVSPAEALHGQYQGIRTYNAGIPTLDYTAEVTTYCLRTGGRCMSYFHARGEDLPLVFAAGIWNLDGRMESKCPTSNDVAQVTFTGTYPLPQLQKDPITPLIGHGHQTKVGSCPLDVDFDETFTRTGN